VIVSCHFVVIAPRLCRPSLQHPLFIMAHSSDEFLVALLEASFDAGFLVEGSTGAVLHANQPAADLFNAPSEESFITENGATRSIDSLVAFWSYSLEHHENDNDDSVDHSERTGGRELDDKLPWEQVVTYASRPKVTAAAAAAAALVSGDASNNISGNGEGPVLEWTITGLKLAPTGTRAQQSHATGKDAESISSSMKESFPGALRIASVPESTKWLVYIRHSDHHDIIRNGSISKAGEYSNASGGVKRSSRRISSRSAAKEPRMTIDENGFIVDINDAALASHEECWKWVTKDLIGKHVSAAQIAKPPGSGDDNAANKNGSRKPPKMLKMLDMVLESGMEPGHSACPMSGFPLRVDPNVSAMTTGGAQREENITEAAFEAALDPIFQIDEHGTIQMVNSAAIKTFGWARHEFLNSDISMICGGGHQAKHAGYMARYLSTGDTRVIGQNRELIAKKKDGSEFPIELGVVEVDTFAGDVRLFCGFVRDLSSIKAREQMAQEMVEAALDPMFQINQHGKILMVNNAATAEFGYDREELIGENIKIICGGSHGNNHDLYIKRYTRTGETRVIGKYRELPAKRKDGSEFPIQLAVVEIGNGNNSEERLFCGFVHNLTRHKRDQEIMKGTIDTSLDPVLHINENGIIQMVNNATCSHLGWTREELVGENVSLIVGGAHQAAHGEYIERYLATGEKRAMGKKRKLWARRKDGSQMPIELGLSEINIFGGAERMFCAFLTDLSGRQTSDHEAGHQNS
jgi:PAS domain S-box-containing protein